MEDSLANAYGVAVVCTDPVPSRESLCWDRLAESEPRLAAIDAQPSSVLVSQWPLVRQPTDVLWFPEFAQWCGSERTSDWHIPFRATAAAVYGHPHTSEGAMHDGVPSHEAPPDYPSEWVKRPAAPPLRTRVFG